MSFIAVGIGLGVAAGVKTTGGIIAKNKARKEQKRATNEYNKRISAYEGLDTSNLYSGMQNTMEDLTINKQQAEFEKQQQMQSQANIAAQRTSASIGQQERQNQLLAARQGARLQQLEAAGATQARGLEYNKTSTLLGMSQQRLAGARAEEAQAAAQIIGGIADIGGAVAGMGAAGAFNGVAGAIDNTTLSNSISLTGQNINPMNKIGYGLLRDTPLSFSTIKINNQENN